MRLPLPLPLLAVVVALVPSSLGATFASVHSSSGPPSSTKRTDGIVKGQYIIEVETSPEGLVKRGAVSVQGLLDSILTHLASPSSSTSSSSPFRLPSFTTRRTYESQPHIFAGAVLKTSEEGEELDWDEVVRGLQGVEGVKRAWPLRLVPRPSPVLHPDAVSSSPSSSSSSSSASALLSTSVQNNPKAYGNDTFGPHRMTGVDRLHAEGVLGAGVKIGVIDTGVDYHNPLLGGCFGPGALSTMMGITLPVTILSHFPVDRLTLPLVRPDSIDTNCSEHGTHVTGIIGALANSYGFSGVAPQAELGMYRIFGDGTLMGRRDQVVDALLQAATDACDIVTLSLGGSAGWLEQSPSQVVVERLNAMGIVTTVSAGNDQAEGLFFADGPAATTSGISVGSIDVVDLPAYPAFILGHPPLPYLSPVPLEISSLPTTSFRVYFTSTDPNATADACSPLPTSTPDLEDRVTVVQRGTCTFDQKMQNVAAKGGKVVLIYNSASSTSMIPYLEIDGTGLTAVASLRREEGLQLLSYYKKNSKSLRMSFPQNQPIVEGVVDTIAGGLVSYYSEFGPTFELVGQPSLAAPGGNILSTFPLSMGGLGVISGTSMACPFVAGSAALLLSQRKSENLDPADVRSLLATTAKRALSSIYGSTVDTVLLQGGAVLNRLHLPPAGLIQVDKALATGTIISPFELALNDTAYLNATQTITLRNTNSYAMSYRFSSSTAQTLGVYDSNYATEVLPSTSPSAIPGGTSRVLFSTPLLVVPAGSSAALTVTILPPRLSRAMQARFPLFSGYIEIEGRSLTGDEEEELSVPFFGLSARMSDMPGKPAVAFSLLVSMFNLVLMRSVSLYSCPKVLDTTATIYEDVKYERPLSVPLGPPAHPTPYRYPFIVGDSAASIMTAPQTFSKDSGFTVYTRLAGGTRFGSIDLVAANVSFTPTISTDRSVSNSSSSSTRMRFVKRSPDVGVVDGVLPALSPRSTPHNSALDLPLLSALGLDPASTLASTTTSSTPAAPRLYTDTPTVGNLATATLLPRDFLLNNSPNPWSEEQTQVVPSQYGFIATATQYRVLVRALKITADPALESSYESWLSYPFSFT
ncbi:SPOSA6832_01108, partial [Sporobolomyces salmonicolor]